MWLSRGMLNNVARVELKSDRVEFRNKSIQNDRYSHGVTYRKDDGDININKKISWF